MPTSRGVAAIEAAEPAEKAELKQLWLLHTAAAARQWLQGRPGRALRPHSLTQYAAMLAAAPKWWREYGGGATLLNADETAIQTFLASRGRGRDPQKGTVPDGSGSPNTRRRYLVLFDELFDHLIDIGLRTTNPAKELLESTPDIRNPGRSAPTFLPSGRADAYVAAVRAQPISSWRHVRDRALRLIFLATGITLEEARTLSAHDVYLGSSTGEGGPADVARLNIERHGLVKARSVPMPSWFVEDMRHWMQLRSSAALDDLAAGDPSRAEVLRQLAPAGPVFVTSSQAPGALASLSDVEIYDIVSPLLRAVGHDVERMGPQTLRNTFAVRQIEHGQKDETIRRWMGLQTNFTLEALRKLLPLAAGETIY